MALTKKAKVATIVSSVLAGVIVLILAVYFLIGGFFFSLALDPNDKSLMSGGSLGSVTAPPGDTSYEHNFDEHDEWFAGSGYTNVKMTSSDKRKYNLNAYQLLQPTASDNWIILIHGYRSEALSMRYYAYNYYQMGFNVLMPDLRGHGLSEGDYIGMGWHDSQDILDWINIIVKNNSSANIALFGVSMGGATTMMTTGLDLPANVKVAVEDCGYSNVYDQFTFVLDTVLQLPREPIMSAASAITSMSAGYNLKKADTVTRLKNSTTPTLFLHGDKDDFVPYYMLDIVYEACGASDKRKVSIEGAVHANSAIVAHELYWSEVTAFISKYIAIKTI